MPHPIRFSPPDHCATSARRWSLGTLILFSLSPPLPPPAVAALPLPAPADPAPRVNAFPALASTPEIDALQNLFLEYLNSPDYYTNGRPVREQLIIWSVTGRSHVYYSLQLPLDGIISMFEATGREDHFLLALTICENMVAAAWLDRNGDGHPEWDGSVNGVPPSDGRPDVFLYDLQGSVCIARLARIILTSPSLNPVYGARANALLDFVENHIIDKWLITHYQNIWLEALPNWSDKASMTARILADIYAARGDTGRRTQAANLCQQFITTVLVYDDQLDSYMWPTITSADTSHTAREPMFIDTCARAGIVFNDNDLRRVGNNLVAVMWNGSFTDPRITNYHTGDNGPVPGSNRGPWEWGLIYDGWVVTGRVHPTVHAVAAAITQFAVTDPNLNPTVYRSQHSNAVIAFTGHLARNLRLNPPCSRGCGDLNGDGQVDIFDFSIFAACFGAAAPSSDCSPGAYACADLTGDGAINLFDWQTFSYLFGSTAPPTPPDCLE